MRRKIKIGQEVVVIRYNFKTNRQRIEKGKVVAISSVETDTQYSERIAVAFKDGNIDDFGLSSIFTKWDEDYIKQEEE